VRETEAEAVAFIVGTAIGIRSSVDATDYIQLYDGNADTLRQSLHCTSVRKVDRHIAQFAVPATAAAIVVLVHEMGQ
jgi:hypothetical protein